MEIPDVFSSTNWSFIFIFLFFNVTHLCSGQQVCPENASFITHNKELTKHRVRACIANCLNLVNPASRETPRRFSYSAKTGNVVNEPCPKRFLPVRKDKIVLCRMSPDGVERLPIESSPSITSCDFLTYEFITYNKKLENLELKVNPAQLVAIQKHIDYIHKMGVKSVLYFGDDAMTSDTFAKISDDKKLREKLLNNMIEFLSKYNLDGILISWIWPGCRQSNCFRKSDKKSVATFASEVLGPLKEKGFKTFFRIDVIGEQMTFLGDYYSDMNPYVDYFPMNNGGRANRGKDKVEFNNPLKQNKDSLEVLSNLVSDKSVLDKVLYEIGPLGLAYQVLDPSKPKINVVHNKLSKIDALVTFQEYCDHLQNSSFTFVKNATTQNHAFLGSYVFTYDDSASLKAKADFMVEKGGGFFIWEINWDIFGGKCAARCGNMHFTRVAAEYLKGGECAITPLCL